MDTGAHWQDFCAMLQQAGADLLAAAPDEATRAEGAGYLARLAAYGVERHLMGAERLTNGIAFSVPRIGGYNPDYQVGSANLSGGRRYRLRGRINGAYRIGVGVYTLEPNGKIAIDDYRVLNARAAELDAEGRFDLRIDPDSTAEQGLRLKPTSNLLLIREIRLKPGDLAAEFALESDAPGAGAFAPTAEHVARSLTSARHFIAGSLRQFLGWSKAFAAHPNSIAPLDPELDKAVQGDPGTRYYTGYFDLRDEQALVIEIPPLACDYWGVQLTNHWLEPMAASHLNHVTAAKDDDGVARIVIAPRDPGCPNWLSTEGRSRGAIFHRTINADRAVTPRFWLRG